MTIEKISNDQVKCKLSVKIKLLILIKLRLDSRTSTFKFP